MAGLAIITEACVDTKDRACVDVCPVQCIYEFNPSKNASLTPRPRPAAVRSPTRTHLRPTPSPSSATASCT